MLFGVQEHEMEKTLTKRQTENLEAYKQGGTGDQAARILGVNISTAQEALAEIAKKLGFSSIKDVVQPRSSEKATAKELMRLAKSQQFKCALSGDEISPKNASLDHKIPRKNGGSDHVDNLQWLSSEVNRMKGSMDQHEFIELCGRIWKHAKE